MSSVSSAGSGATCWQAAEWLAARPERPAEQRLLVEHLAECRACAARAERHAAFDTLLRAHLIATPPAGLSGRLAALAVAAARAQAPARATTQGRRAGEVSRRQTRRRVARWEERAAVYFAATLLLVVFWDRLVHQWLSLATLGSALLGTLQLVFANPTTVWLVPIALDVLAWLGAAVVVLLLFRLAVTPVRELHPLDYSRARRR